MFKKFKGFTLIELLVVIAIIGALSAIGVVAYSGYTEGAKLKSARSMMMQIGLAQTEEYSNYGDYYTTHTSSECEPDDGSTELIGENLFNNENYIEKELGFQMCIYPDGRGFKLVAEKTGQKEKNADGTPALKCTVELDQNGVITESEGC